MNYYGRSTPDTIRKLQKELGDDNGHGLSPYLCGQQNDLIMIKLQGACVIDSGFQEHNYPTSFFVRFDKDHIETLERFKNDPDHKFLEGVISFDEWMKLYKDNK